MTNEKPYEAPDWRALAEDALDLWQTHLSSLANDPRAKDEMARLVQPMNQMFADWATMVQGAARQTPRDDHDDSEHAPSPTGQAADPGSANGETASSDANPAATERDAGREGSSGASDSPVTSAARDSAVTARDRDMAQLALRMATLERRFQTLETLVAGMAAKDIAREQQRAAEARRARAADSSPPESTAS